MWWECYNSSEKYCVNESCRTNKYADNKLKIIFNGESLIFFSIAAAGLSKYVRVYLSVKFTIIF